MNPVTFEDLDSQTPGLSKEPFFMINHSSDDAIHTWLKDNLQTLKSESWQRLEKVKWNYYRYKGIQYLNQIYQPRDVPETKKRYMPQMVLPLIRDAVDEKVARILESKPTVTVIPRDDEEGDKVDAKIAKRFLSSIDYTEKMQEKLRSWLRNAEISGESFLLPCWNPDKGELIDETEELRVGDIEIKQFNPHEFFYEEHPSKDFNQVNYIFFIEYDYTEKIKREYPKAASQIRQESLSEGVFDFETMEEKPLQGFSKKIHFYHRATKFLPKGFYVCFTRDAILKKSLLPKEYQDGKLPGIRLILGKNEHEMHGESSVETVRHLAAQINNYENMIVKQSMLTSYPKWFVESGSIDEKQLNNDVGIVKVKAGASKPILAQANPVSPQLFTHSQSLQEKFYSFAKSNSVVRGEPPSGVSAFVALQYVSEAESRRLSSEVSYFSEAVVNLYDKILRIAACRYRTGEERTMMLVGKENKFNLMKFNPDSLKKNFSVVLQNTSGLPDSRAARVQALIETDKQWPGMVPREQVAEMIGFGQSPEKMYDLLGNAARSAEAENEFMLENGVGIEPAAWEMLIPHWKVHLSKMQDPGFKRMASKQVISVMEDHLLATEMLMLEQIRKSPAFAEQVAVECPQFPVIMEMPIQSQAVEQIPQVMPEGGEGIEDPMSVVRESSVDSTMTGAPEELPAIPDPQVPQPI